jgi:hypothetical protein
MPDYGQDIYNIARRSTAPSRYFGLDQRRDRNGQAPQRLGHLVETSAYPCHMPGVMHAVTLDT